jgi:CheY-like chemotaxis protein
MVQNTESEKTEGRPKGAEAGRGSVLIVDDEDGVQKMLVELLSNEGFECLVASNGEQALKLLEKSTPSLGVLDLALPGISGAELALRIRESLPDLPLIALSGQLKVWAHDDLEDLGFVRVFAKPMDCDDFLRVCREVVDPDQATC